MMMQVNMCVNLRLFDKKSDIRTQNGRVYLQFIDFCPYMTCAQDSEAFIVFKLRN